MVSRLVRSRDTSSDWSLADRQFRLSTGDEVRVGMGPLCIRDLCWFEVFNTDLRAGWDEDHDGTMDHDADSGWIAAGDAQGSYLELARRSQVQTITASGRGSLVSSVVTIDREQVGLSARWALATEDLAPCRLTISLQPGNYEFVTEGLIGVFSEGSTLTQMIPPGEYRLEVEAGVPDAPTAACPWTVMFDRIEPGIVY
jgi:hypothetical protein